MDDWGDELPVINIEQVNQRFDKGSERMAAIERGLDDTTRELGQNTTELAKTRQELHELKQQLADLLEFFGAMKGAFKVLRWLGMLAKPMAAIVALGVALVGAWNAAKGIYPK
ncbi:hypothetical protein [Comamonas sp.]|uniref:hypothetical protein n=1 Tax=Comamonas sp. TaxID=34028 RepID=UPI00289E9328|nr:hypothetical protein [Comamonas sp.]